LSAAKRRRSKALEPDEVMATLFGSVTIEKKRRKKDFLKVHPNDPSFRTALDRCHALALRYLEAGSAGGGIGSAKALVRQQGWSRESGVTRLMEALVKATPEALKFEAGKKSAAAEFPEFRAWHALLEPLFGIIPPEWKKIAIPQAVLPYKEDEEEPEEGKEGDSEDEVEDSD